MPPVAAAALRAPDDLADSAVDQLRSAMLRTPEYGYSLPRRTTGPKPLSQPREAKVTKSAQAAGATVRQGPSVFCGPR